MTLEKKIITDLISSKNIQLTVRYNKFAYTDHDISL